jgi:hypothetical protein
MSANRVPRFPPEMMRSTSPIPRLATVQCLLDEETRTWNLENVQAFFEPEITEQISQTPISRQDGPDFVCWPFMGHGLYTVK